MKMELSQYWSTILQASVDSPPAQAINSSNKHSIYPLKKNPQTLFWDTKEKCSSTRAVDLLSHLSGGPNLMSSTLMVGARIVILHKVTFNINQLINREDISVTYRVCIDVSSYAKSSKTVDLIYVIIDLLQLLEK